MVRLWPQTIRGWVLMAREVSNAPQVKNLRLRMNRPRAREGAGSVPPRGRLSMASLPPSSLDWMAGLPFDGESSSMGTLSMTSEGVFRGGAASVGLIDQGLGILGPWQTTGCPNGSSGTCGLSDSLLQGPRWKEGSPRLFCLSLGQGGPVTLNM